MQVRQSRVCAVDCFRSADDDDGQKTKAEEAQASRVEIAAGME
jgi:hypothetical protein